MPNYRDDQYQFIDQQFERMSTARDYFIDLPMGDPTPYETAYHPVQPTGWVDDGAISDIDIFSGLIRPPVVVTVLPTLPDDSYPIGSFAFLTTDGKLYRTTNGTTWTAAVASSDITGHVGIPIAAAAPALPDATNYPAGSYYWNSVSLALFKTVDGSNWIKAIEAVDIVANTITAGQIAAATITTTQIAAATITGGNIAAATISASNIVANTITAGQIAAGTITATEIAASTITGAKIAAGTITATNIASATITTTQIAANTITASNIAAGTITATEIAAATITGAKIAAATITGSNISANTLSVGLMQDQIGNGVPNGTFEVDAAGTVGNSITNWSVSQGTAANFVTSATTPNDGDKCLLITYDGSGLSQRFQTDYIPVEGGKKYNVVGYMRGKGTNGAGATGVLGGVWFDSSKVSISTFTQADVTVGTSTTYVRQANSRTAPATAAFFRFRAINPNTNTNGDVVGFDGLAFYRLDRDITHGSGNVVIDSTGITITNGYLTLSDQFGNNVLTGAGFGASWLDFIASNFYNNHFAVGTTTNITAATETGGADTDAEYLASLSTDIPYWIVQAESGAGTLKRVADSTAVGGFALQWDGNENATVYQDVPIIPGQRYNIVFGWRFTNSASEFQRTIGYQYRDSSHGAIGSEVDTGLAYTTTQSTYLNETLVEVTTAPAKARYLRVLVQMSRTSGSPTVWLNFVAAVPEVVWGNLYIVQNSLKMVNDPADANPAFSIDRNGSHDWGSGSAATDTNLSRTIAGVLGFIGTNISLPSTISPAQLTSNTNNYNPSGLFAATVLRLSTDASRNLTGLNHSTSIGQGEFHLIQNVGSFDLVLVHQSANSTAGKRFLCPNSANLTLNANDSAWLIYDATSADWRVIGT